MRELRHVSGAAGLGGGESGWAMGQQCSSKVGLEVDIWSHGHGTSSQEKGKMTWRVHKEGDEQAARLPLRSGIQPRDWEGALESREGSGGWR